MPEQSASDREISVGGLSAPGIRKDRDSRSKWSFLVPAATAKRPTAESISDWASLPSFIRTMEFQSRLIWNSPRTAFRASSREEAVQRRFDFENLRTSSTLPATMGQGVRGQVAIVGRLASRVKAASRCQPIAHAVAIAQRSEVVAAVTIRQCGRSFWAMDCISAPRSTQALASRSIKPRVRAPHSTAVALCSDSSPSAASAGGATRQRLSASSSTCPSTARSSIIRYRPPSATRSAGRSFVRPFSRYEIHSSRRSVIGDASIAWLPVWRTATPLSQPVSRVLSERGARPCL